MLNVFGSSTSKGLVLCFNIKERGKSSIQDYKKGIQNKKALLKTNKTFLVAGATRLELATSCVTGMHSNQLNYAPIDRNTYIE